MFCLYGNEIDENGCKLCKCKPRTCGLTSCAAFKCSITTTFYTAADGCTHCRCGQESCPASCTNIFCPTGRRLDVNGCKACACNPQPCGVTSCAALKCSFGQIKFTGDDGCTHCKCRKCPPKCNISCPFGRRLDINGCEGCACKPQGNCDSVCSNSCKYGHFIDQNGCKTCTCRTQACPSHGLRMAARQRAYRNHAVQRRA
ncbi:antistasin-like [Hydractinia symbiolongicarpus]|uniref:antistasin-like n=1 Tax=Hydractinia symbiolongicarpus TaxID=13093 RepID=UPI00254D7D46|nr:antistasin-like [Hydractinia symbiolongicarpus]